MCAPALAAALLLATATPAVTLRFGMDTRGAPGSFVPGLEGRQEDHRLAPRVTKEQLRSLTGLEVDILRAIARQMGAAPEIVPTSWFDYEKELIAGHVDLVLGSWTPTPQTPAAVAASLPYYDWGILTAVRSDSAIHALVDLEGRRVGHIPDPSVEPALLAMQADLRARFVVVEDGERLFEELLAGRLDALLYDSMYVGWRVGRGAPLRVVGAPLNRLGYHVGVLRSNEDLLARTNAAIKALLASGEIARIRAKWEGEAPKR
ncbi:MAG: substrate-binding periplasmic protein [Vicinamibacteria bacterium]